MPRSRPTACSAPATAPTSSSRSRTTANGACWRATFGARRGETGAGVAASRATMDVAALVEKLIAADIAFGRVSDMAELGRHPHLRRIAIGTPQGPVHCPAPAPRNEAEPRRYGAVPAL